MKRNRNRKLILNRETVRKLDRDQLPAVAGGTLTLTEMPTDPLHGESATFQVCVTNQQR